MEIFDQKLSVRETEKLVKKIITPEKKKETKIEDNQSAIIYKSFEEQLKDAIGTKVTINHKAKGHGKIEIEYFSPDEFDRILKLLKEVKKN